MTAPESEPTSPAKRSRRRADLVSPVFVDLTPQQKDAAVRALVQMLRQSADVAHATE